MHAEAYEFMSRSRSFRSVLEIGSRNVNGEIRSLHPGVDYLGIDATPGPGVDIPTEYSDAKTLDVSLFAWHKPFDEVLCCETYEHASNWREITANVFKLLRSGGIFRGTAASLGRPRHGMMGTHVVPEGEHYENICPKELRSILEKCGFVEIHIENPRCDVYWACRKP